MKDLDFDELDRAVNSLIANNANASNTSVVKETTTIGDSLPKTPINSHFAIPSETSVDTVSQVTDIPEPDNIVTPKPSQPVSPLVSRRSSGRFMDVVHPSSDMRTTLIMPNRVSRQGNSVNPLSQSPISDMTTNPHAPQETIAKVPDEIPQVVIPEPISNEWPDPIDFKSPAEDVISDEPVLIDDTDDDEDDDINRINDDIDKTLNQIPDVQESPFLSGAKVTKRPLNAFMTGSLASATEPTPVVAEMASENIPDHNSNDSIDLGFSVNQSQVNVDMPLPAELQGDLLSIESGNATPVEPVAQLKPAILPTPNLTPAPIQAPASVPASVQSPIPARVPISVPVSRQSPMASVSPSPIQSSIQTPQTPAEAVNNVPARVSPVADSPTSISQQYDEKPNTGDLNSGAIYDTDAYHKAMVQPSKKKGSLLWIVWILLLLVVGAGVGAAMYFFVLPLL